MKKLITTVFLMAIASSAICAEDIRITGTVDYTIKPSTSPLLRGSAPSGKPIKLLNVALSPNAQEKMLEKVGSLDLKNRLTTSSLKAVSLPNSVQLGMGNVPVLDQGQHGTCATFAVTGAIDAFLNKQDYISQVCLLNLGNFLEANGQIPSGWNGSRESFILSEIELFGFVSKANQQSYGCAGLVNYPGKDSNAPTVEMQPSEYYKLAESSSKLSWSTVIDDFSYKDKESLAAKINKIKTVLNAKDRVTFGALLVDINLGTVGAVAKHNAANDTWVLTSTIKQDLIDFLNGNNPDFAKGGHAMIITGYDDNAVARDDEGRLHKGLFTIRNSWGDKAGDKGNFYMSYDYFSILVLGAQRIGSYN